MILVIGGPPGSGKTTVAERWAAARGAVLVSAGTRFRAMAKARGLGLEALGRAAERDPSIDRGAREANCGPGGHDRRGGETRDHGARAVGGDPIQIDLRNRSG